MAFFDEQTTYATTLETIREVGTVVQGLYDKVSPL